MKLSRTSKIITAWIGCGVWIILLGFCSLMRAKPAGEVFHTVSRLLESLCLTMGISADLSAAIGGGAPLLLQIGGYMALGLLAWNGLRFHVGPRASLALALAATSLVSVSNELTQIIVPGRIPRMVDWLLAMAGGLSVLAFIWLFQFLWNRFPKLVNRETVSYVVFGVLTTVVNIVAYQVCYVTLSLGDVLRNTVSNTIAWVLAVLFAYAVNKCFVFRSKTSGLKALLWEAGKFIGARVFSFAVDMAGMLLLVNVIHFHSGLSKIGMNVIVMIMNYFFSKWFIFREKKEKTDPAES